MLSQLAKTWREEAERVRQRYGKESLARLCEAHADELEEAVRRLEEEELTIEQAAKESGYSASQLRRLFPDGRFRRRDLPRKAGRQKRPPAAAREVSADAVVTNEIQLRLNARRSGRGLPAGRKT